MLIGFAIVGVLAGAAYAYHHRRARLFGMWRQRLVRHGDQSWVAMQRSAAERESLWIRMGVSVFRDESARTLIFAKDQVYLCAVEFQRRRVMWQGPDGPSHALSYSAFLQGKISPEGTARMLQNRIAHAVESSLGEVARKALREWAP